MIFFGVLTYDAVDDLIVWLWFTPFWTDTINLYLSNNLPEGSMIHLERFIKLLVLLKCNQAL